MCQNYLGCRHLVCHLQNKFCLQSHEDITLLEVIGIVYTNPRLWGDLTAASQYVEGGAYKRAGEGLFTMSCSDRTRGNGLKLKEGRFRLDIRKKFLMTRVVRPWPRRSCGCPLPGRVQGQAGWSSEQPGLVEGVHAHGRGVGTRWSLRSLPTQTVLWYFCCG